jgi:hypothetical protein
LTSSGILALIVIIVVISIGNSHSTPPPAGANSTIVSPSIMISPSSSPTFSFRDDFSNTLGGWFVYGRDASGRYSKGKYQIYLNADATFAFATTPKLFFPPPSIAIEVSARPILGAAADFLYGITCMSDGTGDTGYEFQIQPGSVSIVRFVNGGEGDVLASGGSSAVPSNGENQIRAVCATAGSQIAVHLMLWVNGKKLCDVIDKTNPIETGEVGLIVDRAGNSTEAVAAEFESIVVTQT